MTVKVSTARIDLATNDVCGSTPSERAGPLHLPFLACAQRQERPGGLLPGVVLAAWWGRAWAYAPRRMDMIREGSSFWAEFRIDPSLFA